MKKQIQTNEQLTLINKNLNSKMKDDSLKLEKYLTELKLIKSENISLKNNIYNMSPSSYENYKIL